MRVPMICLVLALASASSRAQPLDLTQPLVEVTFDPGETALDLATREQLRAAVTWAHDHPWRMLVIEAHADRTGPRAENLLLSQQRADAVRAALIQLGVEPQRLVSAAYGSARAGAGRYVAVLGTLGDFRELIEHQHEPHTPAPRPAPQPAPAPR
ncbi:MAG: OmpA family protein [Acidobacteriota bacterium]